MGILLNHAPLVTTLTPGKISLRGEAAGKTVIRSSGKGFLEVFKNTVTILIDSAEVDRPNIPS
jgi:F0F1-type ATP synthase epsilon subunit